MSDVSRALEQIAEIREQLERSEVYRGWRALPVAASGLVGLVAATWQSSLGRPIDAWSFTAFWLSIATLALLVGCSEILWRYATRASETERRRSLHVIGQFLPSLVAGALATVAFLRLSPAFVTVLPGLWALLFGVGVFAARPYLPRASGWVALYYWCAGSVLLWSATSAQPISPWMVGGTFGVGQLVAAGVLYVTVERPEKNREVPDHGEA